MPKLKALAVPALIFLLLIGAQSASASEWVEVLKDSEGMVCSIDRDSIQAKDIGDVVVVWIQITSTDKSYCKDLLEFNFSDRIYRCVARYEYNSRNKITESYTAPGNWNHIIPDSIAEYIYLYLKDLLNQ